MFYRTHVFLCVIIPLLFVTTDAAHTCDADNELVHILIQQDRHVEAITLLETMIAAQPHNSQLYFDLGCTCAAVGKAEQGIQAFEQILRYKSDVPQVLYNIGYIYKMCGNNDAAIACYQRIIEKHPEYENAYFGLGRAYLQKGDFINGWRELERYLKSSGKYAPKLRAFVQTDTLNGKKILLYPEGGFGDTIQFIRYAKLLKEHGAFVTVVSQPELLPLLASCDYIDRLLPAGSKVSVAYDADATLMSMPAVMNSDDNSIPRTVPYLAADPLLIAHWADILSTDTCLRVGMCWQASRHNDSSRPPVARRGIPLQQFYQFGFLKNVSLYSLQKHDGIEQLKDAPTSLMIHTFGNDFDTTNGAFMDTAAIMCNLDLIITVDTAIAHLAGALGKPVWLLLPFETDWRWIARRSDTPWYPTMRIFKQPHPFDWDSVMQEVTWSLIQLLQ